MLEQLVHLCYWPEAFKFYRVVDELLVLHYYRFFRRRRSLCDCSFEFLPDNRPTWHDISADSFAVVQVIRDIKYW